MAFATGVAKQLLYKAESTWGTLAGASGAQRLRRVTSTLSLKKQTYESNEIVDHYQVADFRHGVRSVEGSISGELSPGTWEDFLSAAVRKSFAAVSAITGLSLTFATSGTNYTIVRGSGSFLADGVKAGDVVRITAGSVNAANLNKNAIVLSAVALTLTVYVMNGLAMTAEGPIASCTLTVVGKKAYTPTTSHTDPSFTIEHYHSDITKSLQFSGCKINSVAISLPPTGISTIEFGIMGKDVITDTSAYFTSPTAATTTGVVAAVNGVVTLNGAKVATITGLTINIAGGMSAVPVVGSNSYSDIAEGRVRVTGQLTALFEDLTYFDLFDDETEFAIAAAFTTASTAAADFVSFSMPRVKLGSADIDDGEKNLSQTLSFTALYNSAGGAGTSSEQSTLVIQDSQA